MVTKMVRLSEDAYSVLSNNKSAGESFSDVVCRICNYRPKSLLDLAGILSDDDAEKMKEQIIDARNESSMRSEELMARMQGDEEDANS